MPTSKEEAEEEYARLRTDGAHFSDAQQPSSSTEPKSDLDDTISAEDARNLKEQGNQMYQTGDFTKALQLYTKAANSSHASDEHRAVYLANRAAANAKLQRFQDVVDDTTEALKLKPDYVKARARRKHAREVLKQWRGALEDAKELKQDSAELRRLQFLADDKDKKDQEEAIEGLKGLGNSILSNFGMSLDDIAMEKDPNTGSYNISMKQ